MEQLTPIHSSDKPHKSALWKEFATPTSIVIAGLLIAGGIFLGNVYRGSAPQAQDKNQGASAPTVIDSTKLSGGNDPFVGNPDARVTLYYFFDYQCPFCKQNELDTMPQIFKKYVDSGKVKIVYKDFEFLGPDSDTVALWARAVWELYPDKFQDWHHAIFQNEGTENSGWVTDARLAEITQMVPGIDAAQVKSAVAKNRKQYKDAIDADKAQGQSVGVQGTPSFAVGNQLVVGAQPYAAIATAIDAAVKGVKK